MSDPQVSPERIAILRTLHEQAVEAGKHAALELRRVQLLQGQARDKLQNLRNFEQQYRQQLQALQGQGATWSAVRDLQRFMAKLGTALQAQQEEVRRATAQCELSSRDWAAARQREKAFEVLLEQLDAVLKAQARKQELNELHEWSMNYSGDPGERY